MKTDTNMKITIEKSVDAYTFKPLMGIRINDKPALQIYWGGFMQEDKTFSEVWEELRQTIISDPLLNLK